MTTPERPPIDPELLKPTSGRERMNIETPVQVVRRPDAEVVDVPRIRAERGIPAHTPAGVKGAHELHKYWTKGEGLAKWASSPHPWTALRNHLLKYLPPGEANRTASQWFHDVFGIWPGERKGKNPAGPG